MNFRYVDGCWYDDKNPPLRIRDEDVDKFILANMRAPVLVGRVSPVMVLQLMRWFREGEPPSMFGRPMLDVLNGTHDSWEKVATQFKCGPLIGLWHKHVTLPRHMLRNAIDAIRPDIVIKAAERNGLQAQKDSPDSSFDAAVTAISVTLMRAFDRRVENKAMTGDWLIFERAGEEVRFLAWAPHPDNGEDIDQEIRVLVDFILDNWRKI